MGLADMDIEFVQKLDLARSIAKTPFGINSAVRCEAHNGKSGGRKNSAHLTGNAVDIRCTDSNKRYLIIDALIRVGFNRIGIYDKFIHVDNDNTKPARVAWIDGS
jgi:zinc D-Ala-D-Ala carboxypeptidase